MQQDRSSHICAGAALWAMCYDLHRRYHTPRLFPRQITEIATAYNPKAEFEWGLSAGHMSHVLKHIGCANDIFNVRLPKVKVDDSDREDVFREAMDVLYGYVQSNMPVLLGYWPRGKTQGHAVMIVGHDFHENPIRPPQEDPGQWSSQYVEKWFCSDDQRGPYQPLRLWPDGQETSSGEAGDKKVEILYDCDKLVIIPALTERARMTYRDAKKRIEQVFEDYAKRTEQSTELGEGGEEVARLLLQLETQSRRRLYLQRSKEFRSELLDPKYGRTGLGGPILDAYCRLPLPTHVYVCDFCDRTPWFEGRYGLDGEILLDATAPKVAHKDSVVAVRVEDCMLYYGMGDAQGDQRKREPLLLIDEDYWQRPPGLKLAPNSRASGR